MCTGVCQHVHRCQRAQVSVSVCTGEPAVSRVRVRGGGSEPPLRRPLAALLRGLLLSPLKALQSKGAGEQRRGGGGGKSTRVLGIGFILRFTFTRDRKLQSGQADTRRGSDASAPGKSRPPSRPAGKHQHQPRTPRVPSHRSFFCLFVSFFLKHSRHSNAQLLAVLLQKAELKLPKF